VTTSDKRRDPRNEREELLAAMTLPARKTMLALAGTPSAAADWYNRVADVRAALKVGIEVMEATARIKNARSVKLTGTNDAQATRDRIEADAAMQGAMFALGTITALECALNCIEKMHPELTIKARATEDPPQNGTENRIRRMELD